MENKVRIKLQSKAQGKIRCKLQVKLQGKIRSKLQRRARDGTLAGCRLGR